MARCAGSKQAIRATSTSTPEAAGHVRRGLYSRLRTTATTSPTMNAARCTNRSLRPGDRLRQVACAQHRRFWMSCASADDPAGPNDPRSRGTDPRDRHLVAHQSSSLTGLARRRTGRGVRPRRPCPAHWPPIPAGTDTGDASPPAAADALSPLLRPACRRGENTRCVACTAGSRTAPSCVRAGQRQDNDLELGRARFSRVGTKLRAGSID